MKRILYLSFYYEPDLSAGSFRNTALSKVLAAKLKGEADIHVITTQPNRYASFSEKAPSHEVTDNLVIDRVEVGKHQSGFKDQIISYISYYRAVKKIAARNKYDLVFASSSRLFTSYLARQIAQRNGCPLYLDIRDLFVENMNEIIRNPLVRSVLTPLLSYVERVSFSGARHINLVSEGFKANFEHYAQAEYSYFPNGIDDAFLGVRQDPAIRDQFPKVITYAGNIGEGQGLHRILPEAAAQLGKGYHFRIIGDGGTRSLLEKEIQDRNLTNIELIKPVKRKELIEYYRNSHFLFLHLNKYKAFEKVLPSKLFEYGATDIPVLAGVSGYPRRFLDQHLSSCLVFDPCEATQLAEAVKRYSYGVVDRSTFVNAFQRRTISEQLANSIITYL